MKKNGSLNLPYSKYMFQISEVAGKADESWFIRFPHILCKPDPSFIATLQTEIKKIFNPKANSFFLYGIVQDGYYLLIIKCWGALQHLSI